MVTADGRVKILDFGLAKALQRGPETEVFQGTGFWHVFSGTGRFADATGTGTVRGGANFNLGVFEITLTGQLAY